MVTSHVSELWKSELFAAVEKGKEFNERNVFKKESSNSAVEDIWYLGSVGISRLYFLSKLQSGNVSH